MGINKVSIRQLGLPPLRVELFTIGALLLFVLHQLLFRLTLGELTGDEITPYLTAYMSRAQYIAEDFPKALFLYGQPPFRVFLAWFALSLETKTELALRLPHVIFGFLTCLVIVKITAPWGRWFPVVALLIILGSGFLVTSRVAMGLSAFTFFISFAYYSWTKYVSTQSWWWGSAAWISIALASLTYLEGIFFIPGMLVWTLFSRPQLWRTRQFYIIPITIGLLVLPYIYYWLMVPMELARETGVAFGDLGGWRIFNRGHPVVGNYISMNVAVMQLYSNKLFAGCWIILVMLGLTQKSVRQVAIFGAFPLIYFIFLVKEPTIHVVNFYPILFLLALGGISVLALRLSRSWWLILSVVGLVVVGSSVVTIYRDFLSVAVLREGKAYTWGQNLDIGLREIAPIIKAVPDKRFYAQFAFHDANVTNFYLDYYPVPLGSWQDPEIRFYILDPAALSNKSVFDFCRIHCKLVKTVQRDGVPVLTLFERK